MKTNNSNFFLERGYLLCYHAIHPVFRNRIVYAIACPLHGGGATAVFENKENLERHIAERINYERIMEND
jgi:hypothetical protein